MTASHETVFPGPPRSEDMFRDTARHERLCSNGMCYARGWDATLAHIKAPTFPDFSPRKRLLGMLVDCAQHDFHAPSATHLFFLQYSQNDLMRSFHPLQARAFEDYVCLASTLVASAEDASIQQWASFIEHHRDVRPSQSNEAIRSNLPSGDFPCSGVINVKASETNNEILDALSSQLSTSLGRLAYPILTDALGTLDELTKLKGLDAQGVEVRQFMHELSSARQRTIRIEKSVHACLIGKAHELSVAVGALSSYLFHLYLIRVKSTESLVPRLR